VPDLRVGVLPERAVSSELSLWEFAQGAMTGARRNFTCFDARLEEQKIRILRMFRDISARDRADDVHFEIVLASPLESRFCQRGSETHAAQVLWNFRMTQNQYILA
jgi:hypothetical protein